MGLQDVIVPGVGQKQSIKGEAPRPIPEVAILLLRLRVLRRIAKWFRRNTFQHCGGAGTEDTPRYDLIEE